MRCTGPRGRSVAGWAAALLLPLLASCGGNTQGSDPSDAARDTESRAPDESTESSAPDENTASPTPVEDQWRMLDDFDDVGTVWSKVVDGEPELPFERSTEAVVPPRGDSAHALVLAIPEESEVDLNWHHHFPLFSVMSGVRFWARTSEGSPAELVVAVTGLHLAGHTYASALASGEPWLVQRVILSANWEQHTVDFADLRAEGSEAAAPEYGDMGFMLRFIVPAGPSGELWLDDIELRCVTGVHCSDVGNDE